MQNQNPSLFKPRRVAAKLYYSMISQFMYVWVKNNRPCNVSVQRSEKDPDYLGICFNVENNDTLAMMQELKKDLRIEIIDL